MNSHAVFIEKAGQRKGPYFAWEIQQLRQSDRLTEDAILTDATGLLLSEEVIQSTADATSPSPPPPAPRPAANVSVLNPMAITLLGLVLTPLWSAIVTVVNARRLGRSCSWIPLAIGLGWIVADLTISLTPINNFFVHLALILLATWLLWCHATREQMEQYRYLPCRAKRAWIVPLATGMIGTAYLATILAGPVRPIAAEVYCDEMIEADNGSRTDFLSPELAKQQAILNWLLEQDNGEASTTYGYVYRRASEQFPKLAGKTFVEFSFDWRDRSGPRNCEGFFVLSRDGRTWLIDDIYLVRIDDQEGFGSIIDEPSAIRKLLEPPPPPSSQPSLPPRLFSSMTPPTPTNESIWSRAHEQRGALFLLGRGAWQLLAAGGLKKLLILLAMLAIGKSGLDRLRQRSNSQNADDSQAGNQQMSGN